MSIPLTINGATFEYPVNFDENWGTQATGWAQAVTNGMLQRQGGNFPLTADANFGASFGLISEYFTSRTTLAATTGAIRLAKTDTIDWRNNANAADNVLAVNSIDQLEYNGVVIGAGTGVTSITGTANEIIASSSTGNITLSTPQAIATTSSPTFAGLTVSSLTDSGLTPSTAVVTDGSSVLASSSTTAAEIGFVHGVTSAIQTQITSTVTVANAALPETGGTMSGTIAMGANKITGLANGTATTDAAAYGQIKVVQTVRATSSQQTLNVSSSAYQNTGLSASITLTNGANKVRIWYIHQFTADSSGVTTQVGPKVQIVRDVTSLKERFGAMGIATFGSGATIVLKTTGQVQDSFDDSPGDTAAHTYKTQFANYQAQGLVSLNDDLGAAVMILQEIAG